MQAKDLEEKILSLEGMLYRISMSILKNREDAQDAVQDAILIAYEKVGSLKDPAAFSPWLCRILVRCCYKTLRERKRFVDMGDAFPKTASPDNPCQRVELSEMLSSLSEKTRVVLLLHHVEGYSVKEISAILSIPQGTVKSRLNTAKNALRDW